MKRSKKIASLLTIGLALFVMVGSTGITRAATIILGNNTVGAQTDYADRNYMNGSRHTTGAVGGTVTSMSVYVASVSASPSNKYQVGIYSDSNGSPGVLIAKSVSGTLFANNWNTLSISAALAANTSYWLMYNTNASSNSNNNLKYNNGGSSAYSSNGTTFGTWPTNFGPATHQAVNFSMYATYTGDTTPPPPDPDPNPDNGPGGPVLVISSPSNYYSRYYAEILRAEGLNHFSVSDLGQVDSTVLGNYDVVILGEMPLTDGQTTMLTDWVQAGGQLIAMRPDKKLAPLLGLSDVSSTLSDAYLKIDTTTGPGAGITGDTMQYHSTADKYTLNGATAVATLYSNATNATTNPAVTRTSVGTNGGQAVAFTYDLAKSIVQTRQGNIAWAGQQRDGIDGFEASEMFYGINGQPNWNNLDKAIIPIADEQQRLLANMITDMDKNNQPLPRFWYFPRDTKAVVIMTGDDHANGGTAGRWNNYIGQSPAGCNVDNWECVRASSYLYNNSPLTATQAKTYSDQGFEVGLHFTTQCLPWGNSNVDDMYTSQLNTWKSKYSNIPTPASSRTHCVEWDDWATQAKAKQKKGMRLDADYYYYPASFTQDRPGYFNGTAQIMRFADVDGKVIDTYQATTQMTDESGQSYPYTIDTLLNAAHGSQGYYAALTANMHTDSVASSESDAVIASAKAKGVPVVSGRQMLQWLDARNSSAFTNMNWSGNMLSFGVSGGANGLRGMLPFSSTGGMLTGITFNGNPVTYKADTIKGVQYVFFDAKVGTYTASYAQDITPPTVTTTVPANNATNVKVTDPIKVTLSEPMNAGTITGANITLRNGATVVGAAVSYDANTKTASIAPTLPLATSTTYTIEVQNVEDLAGNSLLLPYEFSFTTAATANLTLGNTQVGSQLDEGDAHHMNGSRITTGSTQAALKSLTVHVGGVSAAPNNQYQLAVYTDNNGLPGTLVAATATGTLTANAWNTLPISATLNANTSYWLMYNTNGTTISVNNMHYNNGSTGQGTWSTSGRTFGSWPSSFGGATKSIAVYSLYATY